MGRKYCRISNSPSNQRCQYNKNTVEIVRNYIMNKINVAAVIATLRNPVTLL